MPQDNRKCLTPGAYYSCGGDDYGNVIIKVRLPFGGIRVGQYMSGHYAITSKAKLKRYEEAFAERDRIAALIHDALEPIIADIYKKVWAEKFAGKRVDGVVMPKTYAEYLATEKS